MNGGYALILTAPLQNPQWLRHQNPFSVLVFLKPSREQLSGLDGAALCGRGVSHRMLTGHLGQYQVPGTRTWWVSRDHCAAQDWPRMSCPHLRESHRLILPKLLSGMLSSSVPFVFFSLYHCIIVLVLHYCRFFKAPTSPVDQYSLCSCWLKTLRCRLFTHVSRPQSTAAGWFT